MKRVLIICSYPENVAPSQRLKYEQYFPYFEEEGYSVTVSPFISDAFWKKIYKKGYLAEKVFHTFLGYCKRVYDLFRMRQFDIVYVHLWGTPIGPPIYEWLMRMVAKKLIYDIDDLVYLKHTKSEANPLVSYIKGRRKPIYLMKHADHVITCTPYLDEFVRKYNENSTDISSTVDTKKYKPVNTYQNDRPLTIGWSGSLSTSRFFLLLQNVLKRISQKYDVNILVMGDEEVKMEGVNLIAVPWSEAEELSNLQKMDIGVYPLPDEEWVYGKSGLKAIQYMALGIPTVATAIGTNYRVIENGVSGFLVNKEEEWIAVLSNLIENPDLRKKIGENGRKRVEAFYSIESNKHAYLEIFDKLVK